MLSHPHIYDAHQLSLSHHIYQISPEVPGVDQCRVAEVKFSPWLPGFDERRVVTGRHEIIHGENPALVTAG